jgi:hypothetical protein
MEEEKPHHQLAEKSWAWEGAGGCEGKGREEKEVGREGKEEGETRERLGEKRRVDSSVLPQQSAKTPLRGEISDQQREKMRHGLR